MAVVKQMLATAATGAMLGAGGMIISSMVQVGKMPPMKNVLGASAFMGTVLGFGSVVRGR